MQKRWLVTAILLLTLLALRPLPIAEPTFRIGLSLHGNQLPLIVDDGAWWTRFHQQGFTMLLTYISTMDTLLNHGDYRAFTMQLPDVQRVAQRL